MFSKWFLLPLVLGICLGVILTGVQISATALSADLGPGYETDVLDLPKALQGNNAVRKIQNRAADFCNRGLSTAVSSGENACRSLAGWCRETAGTVYEKWRLIILNYKR